MLRHLAVGIIGFAALVGTVGTAAADKGGHYRLNRTLFPYPYVYTDQSTSAYVVTTPKVKRYRAGPKLDFETEAVHRNLRPEYFD
jgi:hypothetical protein